MTRKRQQNNNGFNRNNQTPHNNGPYANGPCNRTPYSNGTFNNASFNNGLFNNGLVNRGPQNSNLRNSPHNNGPRNTDFYNRVSHNNPPRNIVPNSIHAYQHNRPNNNNNPQGGIARGPETPDPKNQAAGKTTEDRTRLLRLICEYYRISNIQGILKDPGHAPVEWDNLLLNKIYWLRNHEVDLQEIREGLGRHIGHRIRKGTKRSDRPVKPYVLPQDVEALIKDVSESEASSTNPKAQSKVTPIGPKKRAASGSLMSEQPGSTKRRRRAYASPDSSVDTDVDSSCPVVRRVSDQQAHFGEQLCTMADNMRQAMARVRDTKAEFEKALAALEKEERRFNRMAKQAV
ncbi:uncharacterized protein ColSpa_12425 [Colletotrichum spaethianum]|uniref:Uncharacterized protein n=1 Tax=Colletotrichum spaethianum TaxID=700344 RepID=A0AA37UL54_9PEZI|nr:uncharacterized protein ColSpa_12425 [Colletotrichum spaethianum]GKT52244.1 hypothetical protein ColSpa_12425 [Colletotrichum spaethianum]